MAVNQRALYEGDRALAQAMLGFASFAAAGGLVHVWQRIHKARYNASTSACLRDADSVL